MTIEESQKAIEDAIASSEIDTDCIEVSYTEADKKLTKFVEENIAIMQTHLLSAKSLDLQSINNAYINYMSVSLSLNSLYQKVKLNAAKAKENLDFFDDQAMNETKQELNREDNRKNWYSATELKAAAHTKYKARYAQLHAKADLAESRRSFVERLCKAWESWQFGLGQLSRNLVAEANANGLDMQAQKILPVDPDDKRVEDLVAAAMNS